MMAYLGYYAAIHLAGISKTTKILRHDDQLRFDSNTSLVYTTTTTLTSSVTGCLVYNLVTM
jgi:hypothetical protein